VCAIKVCSRSSRSSRKDDYFKHLVDVVNPEIVSEMDIGEQPAIVAFATIPAQRLYLWLYLRAACSEPGDAVGDQGQELGSRRKRFARFLSRLRTCRNSINPIRVLHSAVRFAGIADTGPVLPMLSPPTEAEEELIAQAAKALRENH
jgi:hypothetical protein